MTKYQDYFNTKFAEIEANMATKACIEKLHDTIKLQNEKIDVLEAKVAMMESLVSHLTDRTEEQEQYSRRLCIRIDGIDESKNKGESGDESLEKVKKVFQELKVVVPDAVIDRAHRIGKPKTVNGKQLRTMIVRFTTWRHRTIVYRARKNSKKYKVRLDLTKPRLEKLVKLSKILEDRQLGFVFADVNCRLVAFIEGKYYYPKDEHGLMEIIGKIGDNEDNERVSSDGTTVGVDADGNLTTEED